MNKILKVLLHFFTVIFLTLTTQIGGVIYLVSLIIISATKLKAFYYRLGIFIVLYLLSVFVIVPPIAKWQGRIPIQNTENLCPTNYMTILLNRNYVVPEMNQLLQNASKELAKSGIKLKYLDANFPFINGFPLPPHLSHNDGRKVDLSLIYEDSNHKITNKKKSISGYGVFAKVKNGEVNQPQKCLDEGYFQYDYPQYFTFGSINNALEFSEKGTKTLMNVILQQPQLGKVFIEPHLKNRLGLANPKIRYHGCRAVRHDDHIHIQL